MPQSETRQIDRIIDIARGVSPLGPSERENREATRMPFAGQVAVVQVSTSGEKTAPILMQGENISSGGLCVVTEHELPVGGRRAVLLQKSDGEAVIIAARVVYANPIGVRGFECGLEFEMRQTSATMDDFSDAAGNLPHIGPALAA